MLTIRWRWRSGKRKSHKIKKTSGLAFGGVRRFDLNKIIIKLSALLLTLIMVCSCSLPGTETPTDETSTTTELVTIVNDNVPYFTKEEKTVAEKRGWFIDLSELDNLGRVGVAYALLDFEHMPPSGSRDFDLTTEPSGWVQKRYPTDIVENGWLWNRAHTIGWAISGIGDEPKALMTGTRMFNTPGMLDFENMTNVHMKDYPDHQVLYRVTPDFEGSNLVAYGVLMESDCLQCDDSADYCVYIANIQPGVVIDYATGESRLAGDDEQEPVEDPSTLPDAQDYVVNKSNNKFHLPTCRYADSMSQANRQEITAPRSWMIENGYEPCGVCNP